MSDSVGSIDCPDCQLQLLQQQQHNSIITPSNSAPPQPEPHNNNNASPSSTTQISSHDASLSRSASSDYGSLMKQTSFSQLEVPTHYPLSSIPNVRTSSSSGGLNIYYGTDYGSSSSSTPVGISSGTSTHQTTPATSLQGLPTHSSSSMTSYGCDLNFSGSVIETCDYNGYCSTCAVLDLPTNDKFYRPGNPRPHVFPPIFYSQGPSSVIPCFSPIPDWTSEYNHYAYPPGTFSQPASSVPVVPQSADFYSTGTNVGHGLQNSSNSSSYDACSSTISSMAQSTYSHQPYSIHQPIYCSGAKIEASHLNSTLTLTTSVSNPPSISSTIAPFHADVTSKYKYSLPQVVPGASNSTSTPVTNATITRPLSPSSSAEVSSNDSSCDSDSDTSILSNDTDRELISVVEEDDDETQSTKEVRPGGKCLICRNLIEITDCSSPQLAKMLENIENDIGADDLDITVSSGDIEIVGMEDVSSEFTQQKKRYASSTTPHSIVSITRLALLMGESEFGLGTTGTDNDVAVLCFRCGKLASMADSLERQLSTAIQSLHHKLMSSHSQEMSYTSTTTNVTQQQICHGSSDLGISNPTHNMKIRQFTSQGIQTDIETRLCMEKSVGPETEMELLRDASTQYNTQDFPQIVNIKSPLLQKHDETEESSFYSSSSVGNSNSCSNTKSTFENSTNTESPSNVVGVDCHPVKIQNSIEIIVVDNVTLASEPSLSTEPEEPHLLMNLHHVHEPSPREDMQSVHPSNDSPAALKISPCAKLANICSHCQRAFSTKSNLKAHVEICVFKKTHDKSEIEGEPENMKCEKCGVGFRSVLRKQQHTAKGCKLIAFECMECSRRFSKASELKAHVIVHRGEKPFQCGECGASFSTKGNQMAHSRMHSKDKKFQCSHCEKGFNRRFALTVHLNRHNGVKPFVCNVCNQRFPDPSNLNKHKKRVHVLEQTNTKDKT